MNSLKLGKVAAECAEAAAEAAPSNAGWAARCAALGVLAVLAAVSTGCSQAQAAESQDQEMSKGGQKHHDDHRSELAGLYYARVRWDFTKASQELPVRADDAVMLGSDGSLTGFNGTENAAAFPLFWTNSAGSLGSWQARGNHVEIKFFRMLTMPASFVGKALTLFPGYSGDLVPTPLVGFATGRIEGEVHDGVITGHVHLDTFATVDAYCRESGTPCLLRAITGAITLTLFDPAVGPPASLFQP